MTLARTAVRDFSTSNKIYVNAVVTFYTVLNGAKTSTLADVYDSISGGSAAANPQTLDSYGKFRNPVYIDAPVIMSVSGLGNTPDHDTGVIDTPSIMSGTGAPESVVTASVGTLYLRSDGGAGTTLYVKESGTGNTGWSAK